MRKVAILLLVLFVSALTASAQENQVSQDNQDNVVSLAPSDPAASSPQGRRGYEFPDWQIALGYQLNGIRLHDQQIGTTQRFSTSGLNASVTRFFNDWFGVEAQVGVGFGHTGKATIPNNLVAKSAFVAGGAHIAYRSGSRLEPFGHALIGIEHFRFTQTAGPYGSNTGLGYLLGAGVDYHLTSNLAIRGEGDYLGTHFFKANQRNYQIVIAAVMNF